MIQVAKGPAGFEVKELFKRDHDTCGSQIHQPVLYKDHLYMHSNSNEGEHGMLCLSLDGEVKWRTVDTPGLPRFERGNLLLADGLIFALDGKTGVLHLVEPSPEGYKELAQTKLFESREMWAPMALSDGKLLVRDQTTLKCLDVKNP
jgi:outer membrane protein assembly factor BamB